MTPRLEACYFGTDANWQRMAAVLRWTAVEQCGTWNIQVRHVQPRRHRSDASRRSNVSNTQKFEEWCRIVAEAPDGERVLLIDADTAILRPLEDIWVQPFDLAYTVKPGARFPFNGGVIFLRVSPAVRALFARWWEENIRMLHDATYHAPFRKRYGGLNQAAFGALLERGAMADLQLLTLPCPEWNCENESWPRFDPTVTRILHIKDGLCLDTIRGALFNPRSIPQPPFVRTLADLWRGLEAQSQSSTRRTA